MTMTATVNSDCSVDYTAYISDIYDFDHNSWLQTRFAALEKYGYAAPFNVRGNISGTYRKYKEWWKKYCLLFVIQVRIQNINFLP
mgnify:FL=1